MTKPTTGQPAEPAEAAPTLQEIGVALEAWLKEHGVKIVVCALGLRSRQIVPIDDHISDLVEPTFTLVQAKKS